MVVYGQKPIDSTGNDFGFKQTEGAIHTIGADASGEVYTVQNPLSTNGDSVYVKDLDVDNCDNGNFEAVIESGATGTVEDYFDSLKSVNCNSTADDPKSIKLWFQRTVYAHEIGLGCDDISKGFGTSVTVKLLGSGEAVRFSQTFTSLDPNSALVSFGPKAFNGVILEFNTADEVCLSNITIREAIETTATLKALKPDGTVINIDATTGGNLKVSLEEIESAISDDSNSRLMTSPYPIDEFANVSRLLGDNIFKGALITIPVEHHEIHCGDSYEMSYITDLANGGVLDILVIVPNEGLSEIHPGDDQDIKQYHFKGTVATEAEATIEFFENVIVSANGTALDVFCRNRNVSLGDELAMYHTPTVTNTGTRIMVAKSGSGRTVGGTITRADEFILRDNTSYLLRITNDVTTNEWVSVYVDYYVHPGV